MNLSPSWKTSLRPVLAMQSSEDTEGGEFEYCCDVEQPIKIKATTTPKPFSTKIFNPSCLKYNKWKNKRVLYDSYHELAYLHPNYFTPDAQILNKYDFSLINHFSHWQFLELGYLIKRAKKYFKLFSAIEKILNFLKLSSIPVPYNLGQTTFIFKKNNE